MDIISLKQAKEQNLKFYFTGKPCKHGHIALRYTSVRCCVECYEIWKNNRRNNTELYEKDKKTNSEWYRKNKQKKDIQNRKWKQNNKKQWDQYQHDYYHNDDPSERWKRKAFNAAKTRAKKKNIEFSIERKDVYIPKYCQVLGIELKFGEGRGGFWDNSPTIDRKDNSKGYTKDNICVISHRANALKSNATPEELDALAEYAGRKYKK